jgi:hypothetical protein
MLPLLFLIGCFTNSYSQSVSLEDTKNWIKDKLESNGYQATDGSIKHQYSVAYDGCSMVITNTTKNYFKGEVKSLTTVYQIPIYDLSGVILEKKERNTWIIFPTRSTSNIIRVSTKETNTSTWEKSISIILSSRISEGDMPARLDKAFTNLITLCGGKLTKEVF